MANYCSNCGKQLPEGASVCPSCGAKVAGSPAVQAAPVIVNIENNNTNTNSNVNAVPAVGRQKNKWVAFFLCLFLGFLGAHKFYEGKVGMGILYLFTGGLFAIGIIVDLITLLFKPTHYFVP